jgi:hypothetical protein
VLDALAGAAAVCVTAFLCLRLQPSHRVRRTGFEVGRPWTREGGGPRGRFLRPRPDRAGLGRSVAAGTPSDEQSHLHRPPARDRGSGSVEVGCTPDERDVVTLPAPRRLGRIRQQPEPPGRRAAGW